MDVKELRIGNHVKDLRTNEVVDVQLLFYGNKIEDYYPIPLTEEWLFKFGFKGRYLVDDVYGWFLNGFIYVCAGQIRFECEEDGCIALDRNPLNYVHQLQNLYFALTGEELTIKNF